MDKITFVCKVNLFKYGLFKNDIFKNPYLYL